MTDIGKQAFTIACLGDSITGTCDLSRFVKWPEILALLCEARCGAGRTAVINRGIAGNTTAQMLDRLPEVLAAPPQVLVLLAGGNDAGQDMPREATARNLREIVSRASGAGARILGLNYHLVLHPGAEAQAWKHLPRNNDLLAEAVLGAGGSMTDTAAAMALALRSCPPSELTGPDAVHLSPGGELVYARTVFAALDRLGWLPTRAES